MQAPRKAASTASSTGCLVAMLKCIPLTAAIKRICYLNLLDGHKKKQFDRAKKEDFCAMAKAFRKASIKGKKACKRLYQDSSESDSSLEEE
eukprot:11741625-Ditylum_brightwellii.AAC.1